METLHALQIDFQDSRERARSLEAEVHRLQQVQEKQSAVLKKAGKHIGHGSEALHDAELFNKWGRYAAIMVSPWVEEEDFKDGTGMPHLLEAFPTEEMRQTLQSHSSTRKFVCSINVPSFGIN